MSKPSPVQELRQRFGQHFVPSVEMLAQRLGERGIVVQMDASDFLGGGRISSGPMLRTRSLTAETFVRFLYEQVIKLVQEVARRS